MYSAYKLNKQGDNIEPWHTPFPFWNHSVVPCPVLSVASWPAYRFLRRQVRWSVIPITLKISCCDLELPCFFDDPVDVVGNLISGSSAFSKSTFNIWKFTVHILFKPGLENFEHYIASMWDECNCVVVWAFFAIAFLWDWKWKQSFSSLWPLLSFPNLLACWVQHFNSINSVQNWSTIRWLRNRDNRYAIFEILRNMKLWRRTNKSDWRNNKYFYTFNLVHKGEWRS